MSDNESSDGSESENDNEDQQTQGVGSDPDSNTDTEENHTNKKGDDDYVDVSGAAPSSNDKATTNSDDEDENSDEDDADSDDDPDSNKKKKNKKQKNADADGSDNDDDADVNVNNNHTTSNNDSSIVVETLAPTAPKPPSRRKQMMRRTTGFCVQHEMVFACIWIITLFLTACLTTGALYSPRWHYLKTQITRDVVFENTTITTFEDATNSCGLVAYCRYYSEYGGFIHADCSTFGSEVSSIPTKDWRNSACFLGVAMILSWVGVMMLVACLFCDVRLRKPVAIFNIIIIVTLFIGLLLYGTGLKDAQPPVLGETFTLKGAYCKFCPRAESYNNGDCTFGSGGIAAIFAFVFATISAIVGVWVPSNAMWDMGDTEGTQFPRTTRQSSTLFRPYKRNSVGPGSTDPDDLALMSPIVSPTTYVSSPLSPNHNTLSPNHNNPTDANSNAAWGLDP